jgi:hypothetical protein
MENNRNVKVVYASRGSAGLSGMHRDDDEEINQNGLFQRCPDVLAKIGQHLGFKPGVVAEPAEIAR